MPSFDSGMAPRPRTMVVVRDLRKHDWCGLSNKAVVDELLCWTKSIKPCCGLRGCRREADRAVDVGGVGSMRLRVGVIEIGFGKAAW